MRFSFLLLFSLLTPMLSTVVKCGLWDFICEVYLQTMCSIETGMFSSQRASGAMPCITHAEYRIQRHACIARAVGVCEMAKNSTNFHPKTLTRARVLLAIFKCILLMVVIKCEQITCLLVIEEAPQSSHAGGHGPDHGICPDKLRALLETSRRAARAAVRTEPNGTVPGAVD